MYVIMSFHYPVPGKEELLIDSMHRFGKAVTALKGCRGAYTLKDRVADRLVGIALWDSEADYLVSESVRRETVKDDKFDEWELKPYEMFHLDEV